MRRTDTASSSPSAGLDRKQEIREALLQVLLEALHGGGEPVAEAGQRCPPSSQGGAVIERLEDLLDRPLQARTAVGDHQQRGDQPVRRQIPEATPSQISSKTRT